MNKILCVDDDRHLTDLLQFALTREGFEVVLAHTGQEALRLVRSEKPDLVILDVNLADTNGFKLLAAFRTFSQVPVIMLTARSLDEDLITGFEQGADDYVIKPFNMQTLIHRARAVLRRAMPHPAQALSNKTTYHLQGTTFDTESNTILGETTQIKLTPTESRILHVLALNQGQVLSAERIMEYVGGYNSASELGVIKTHIGHLRKKISTLPGNPQIIRTLPGAGYMVPPSDESSPVLTDA